MNMKNEDEKSEDFFYLAKIFKIMFFWNFKHRWFQICIQIFHIFLRSKVTAFQSTQKWPKTGKNRQNGPTLEGCNFWWKQDMKNLNTDLKSAKFKVSEKYKFKYFGQVEKIFIFFIFIFHLHFQILWNFLWPLFFLLRIIFSTRYYFLLHLSTFKSN